jgi:general secretion pathway protein G
MVLDIGKTRNRAFTLIEVLVVVVVIAILAAVVLPKFVNSGLRGKEAALRANLKLVRNAAEMFHNDCDAWPAALLDLTVSPAPANGKDDAGSAKAITAANWKGPYLSSIEKDPVSAADLTYSVAAGTVGKVNSSATGSDTAGVAYSAY